MLAAGIFLGIRFYKSYNDLPRIVRCSAYFSKAVVASKAFASDAGIESSID